MRWRQVLIWSGSTETQGQDRSHQLLSWRSSPRGDGFRFHREWMAPPFGRPEIRRPLDWGKFEFHSKAAGSCDECWVVRVTFRLAIDKSYPQTKRQPFFAGQLSHTIRQPPSMSKTPVFRPDVQFLHFERPIAFDHECPRVLLFKSRIPNLEGIDPVILLVTRMPPYLAVVARLPLEQLELLGGWVDRPTFKHVTVEVFIRHVAGAVVAPGWPFESEVQEPPIRERLHYGSRVAQGEYLIAL